MNLGHNALSGSISTEIENMKNVKELYLEGNKLTGIIPKEMATA
jgi:Leucine-rich repeat (LRR) protein